MESYITLEQSIAKDWSIGVSMHAVGSPRAQSRHTLVFCEQLPHFLFLPNETLLQPDESWWHVLLWMKNKQGNQRLLGNKLYRAWILGIKQETQTSEINHSEARLMGNYPSFPPWMSRAALIFAHLSPVLQLFLNSWTVLCSLCEGLFSFAAVIFQYLKPEECKWIDPLPDWSS